MNFSEIFGKNVIYDDIKSDQKTKLYSLQAVVFFKYIFRVMAWISFLNETSMLAFAELAILHSILIRTSFAKIVRKITM